LGAKKSGEIYMAATKKFRGEDFIFCEEKVTEEG